jgi:hypothetical protein
MEYNLCIVRPPGNPHTAAFDELAEVIAHGLHDLGHVVHVNDNHLMQEARNIMIGCHHAEPGSVGHVPAGTIIVNTEQIHVDEREWNERIYFWASRFETWDYSERNLAKLHQIGIRNTRHLTLGFHPALRRIPPDIEQDIDVLFYGSIGPRRQAVLDELASRGLKVCAVHGVYGEARDALIARAKVVLNLHHYASHIFEIVRVFYLMTNGKAVVGEVSPTTAVDPDYVGGFRAAPYDALADACVELVRDADQRRRLEATALGTIMRMPQAGVLAPLLARKAGAAW